MVLFFFKQKTAYDMRISDWSSDVCSSDLELPSSGELPDPQQSLTRYLRLGFIMIGALLLSLLIAATLVQITGAVVGSGEVAVASKVKTIAHPDGGVIAQIWVRDGDRVKAGDPLIRFDTTVTARSEEHTSELQSLMRI